MGNNETQAMTQSSGDGSSSPAELCNCVQVDFRMGFRNDTPIFYSRRSTIGPTVPNLRGCKHLCVNATNNRARMASHLRTGLFVIRFCNRSRTKNARSFGEFLTVTAQVLFPVVG